MSELSRLTDVCRLCGKEEAFLLAIFSKPGKEKHIAQKIEICLPKLEISPSDELSRAICYKCMFILEQCSDFCTRATNANEVMKRHYSTTARPQSSSEESEPVRKKRITTVTADKYGRFPRQSVSVDWCSMGDNIAASGSSGRSSEDSLSHRTSRINIRSQKTTSTQHSSKSNQQKTTLGAKTRNYHMGSGTKGGAWGSSEESEATPPEKVTNLKRNQKELDCNTVEQSRHTNIATSSTFDPRKKTTPKDQDLKAYFDRQWMEDPDYLPSPERETDYESEDNKSWSSARTTISDLFGKVPRKKTSKPKEQKVPVMKCVNSMQNSALKKVSMWEKRVCSSSNTDSDSCGGLTPELGPQWCRKE